MFSPRLTRTENMLLTTSPSTNFPFAFFLATAPVGIDDLGVFPTFTPLPEADTPVRMPLSLSLPPRDGLNVLEEAKPSATSLIIASPSLSLVLNLELSPEDPEIAFFRASGMGSEGVALANMDKAVPGVFTSWPSVARAFEEGAGDPSYEVSCRCPFEFMSEGGEECLGRKDRGAWGALWTDVRCDGTG